VRPRPMAYQEIGSAPRTRPDAELVTSGPYGKVRHPICSG
jgi:protein-S-isoprenylcysteine O-methyltransferase Ste14